jgi:short-subunit dehydrogenase
MAAAERAVIVGAGAGLSAALARKCTAEGMEVFLAARDTAKLTELVKETGATAIACDATSAADVEKLFTAIDAAGGLDLVVYNASGRARGRSLISTQPRSSKRSRSPRSAPFLSRSKQPGE